MMSRPTSKVTAYGKGARDWKENTLSQSAKPSQESSNLYDFPDSDDAAPTPPRPKGRTAAKPPTQRRAIANAKPPTLERPSATSTKSRAEDNRKRKHAKAFEARAPTRSPQTATQSTANATNSIRTAAPTLRVAESESQSKNGRDYRGSHIDARHSVTQRNAPAKTSPTVTTNASKGLPAKTNTTPRKSRLIDRLAAQKSESSGSASDPNSSSESDEDADSDHGTADTPSRAQHHGISELEGWSRPTYGKTGPSTSKKVRHTYSQARSIKDDLQPQQEDPFDLHDDSLMSSPPPKASLADEFDFEDDDEDDPKIAIKSVHELRRAGANHRFADEMDDLFSRIGNPCSDTLSMRRGALLELAQRLQTKEFASQFRDHAARDNVAKNIGADSDIISGFAMSTSLVIFLSSHNAPHLLRRLVEEKIGKLLGRQLRTTEDINVLAAERSVNLSKTNKTAIDSIRSAVSKLRIWHGNEPRCLSPRSVALQLCYMLQCHLEPRYRSDLSRDMNKDFIELVETHLREEITDGVDYTLIVLIMEAESGMDTSFMSRDQLSRRACLSARIFRKTLDSWPQDRDELDSMSLKLAINTTNTQVGAEAFGDGLLLAKHAQRLASGLQKAQQAVANETLEASMYDDLLLILGIMINVLEHYPSARASLDADSLELLSTLFLGNRDSVGDADSVDKSKVSIAFGYLAVILGYLCLDQRGRAAVENSRNSGVRDLVASIREFIGLYRNVDSKNHELEGLAQELRRYCK